MFSECSCDRWNAQNESDDTGGCAMCGEFLSSETYAHKQVAFLESLVTDNATATATARMESPALIGLIKMVSVRFELSSEEVKAALGIVAATFHKRVRRQLLAIAIVICFIVSKHRQPNTLVTEWAEKLNVPSEELQAVFSLFPNHHLHCPEDVFDPQHHVDKVMMECYELVYNSYMDFARQYKEDIHNKLPYAFKRSDIKQAVLSLLRITNKEFLNTGKKCRPVVVASLLCIAHARATKLFTLSKTKHDPRLIKPNTIVSLEELAGLTQSSVYAISKRQADLKKCLIHYAKSIPWLRGHAININSVYTYMDDIVEYEDALPNTPSSSNSSTLAKSQEKKQERLQQLTQAIECMNQQLNPETLDFEVQIVYTLLLAGCTPSEIEVMSDKDIRHQIDEKLTM